jgi:hypothetical protein
MSEAFRVMALEAQCRKLSAMLLYTDFAANWCRKHGLWWHTDIHSVDTPSQGSTPCKRELKCRPLGVQRCTSVETPLRAQTPRAKPRPESTRSGRTSTRSRVEPTSIKSISPSPQKEIWSSNLDSCFFRALFRLDSLQSFQASPDTQQTRTTTTHDALHHLTIHNGVPNPHSTVTYPGFPASRSSTSRSTSQQTSQQASRQASTSALRDSRTLGRWHFWSGQEDQENERWQGECTESPLCAIPDSSPDPRHEDSRPAQVGAKETQSSERGTVSACVFADQLII